MKKKTKKLVLAKETLQILSKEIELEQIAGASILRMTCNNLSACNHTYCC